MGSMANLSVEEQLKILMHGTADVVSEAELRAKLEKSAKTGKPLRVKLGIDPTGKDLTLGHTVPLRKLKQFIELGHQGVLIIGDYTAMIGDPTGRNEARPQLTHEQTTENAKRYLEQAARVLDISKLEIRRNSEWLAPMTFADVTRLAAKATVAQMLEREDFKNRYAEGRPIFIHEFFYPLMQGTDSVALEADVELGGMDQKFNLLTGRDLQREAGQEPQVCMMMPIIEGLDGVQKMSKSLGNYIGLDHPPLEMFGRTMSIPDHLIITYFTYFTDLSLDELGSIKAALASGENPMNLKKRLGREIITTYGYSAEEAAAAEEAWVAQFSRGEVPADIPDVEVPASALPIGAGKLLVDAGMAPSMSEARRLIQQGGFSLDGEKVTDPQALLALVDGQVMKVGKRKWGRVRIVG
jgi:tyrosyl-tRNA synthetase